MQNYKPPGAIKSYRDLVAWQKGIDLSVLVMSLALKLPPYEAYGLSQQLRKAAVSVPSNVAEGWGRGTILDYLRFLRVARGSVCEIETQLLIAVRMNYLSHDLVNDATSLCTECSLVLQGLIYSLERQLKKQTEKE